MNACILNTLTRALAGCLILFSSVAQASESTDPIKIVLNNWSSQQVLAHVSGELLMQSGYQVEYYKADTQLQFQAIGNGDLHFQVEVWEGTMAMPFEQQVTRGRMVDAGSHEAISREDWWYPDYMEKICPGLPDWQALNKCAPKLATPATKPLGRYLAGPVDWERPDRERIEALGLSFEIVNVTDSRSLWAELDRASRNQQPIVMMNWTPNWTEAKYPGKFVEFPPHNVDCETEAEWGINPELTHDCGNPAQGWLKKGVWSGMPEKWPCAFELIKNINFNNTQIATAAAYAEIDEMSPEEAARRWIGENQAVWEKWLPACAEKRRVAAATATAPKTVVAASPAKAGEALAKKSNCLGCHGIDDKLVGPALKDVAARYEGDAAALDILVQRIKSGSSGNWGAIPMPPNTAVSDKDAKTLAEWVLSL